MADEPLTIQPGNKLSGTYYLAEKLPSISQVLRRSDVLILWAYGIEQGAGVVTGVAVVHKTAPAN
jgi:hypothetical protein